MVDRTRRTRVATLPEVVVSTSALTATVRRGVAAGRLRKIGPRLYTTNLVDSPAAVVRRSLWIVLGQMVPGAIVSFRTALEGVPAPDGRVYLSGRYARTIRLPGHDIHIARGPGPLAGDAPFVGALFLASRERALLESLAAGRRRAGARRGIAAEALQDRLERTLQIGGEQAINQLRDRTRALAPSLHAEPAFQRIDQAIGTLLGTRRSVVTSPAALARLAGRPYDAGRMPVLERLMAELRARPAVSRADRNTEPDAWHNFAFFDAYFSNYIEGTEFELDDALAIVFANRIPVGRPQDAHDILGTYRLLVDRAATGRSATAGDADAFILRLQAWHAQLLAERPEVEPGAFKVKANRAGETVFVAPELVQGTLQRGFEIMRGLTDPFALAAFVMFLVAEVHPFDDGNGRLARIAMNAELTAAGESRVLIPIVYREDYLLSLRALSRQQRPAAYVAMLDRAHRFASEMDFRSLAAVTQALTDSRAFLEPRAGRLLLPSERASPGSPTSR